MDSITSLEESYNRLQIRSLNEFDRTSEKKAQAQISEVIYVTEYKGRGKEAQLTVY